MISISELCLLKIGCQKELIPPEDFRSLILQSRESGVSLMALLEKEGFLTKNQKERWLEEARSLPQWPFHPANQQRENQGLYNLLVQREILLSDPIPPDSPDGSLYRQILEMGSISPGDLMESLGVEKPGRVECPLCQYQIELNEYRPWRRYPCLFCPGLLKKVSSADFLEEKTPIDQIPEEEFSKTPFPPEERKFSGPLVLGLLVTFLILLSLSIVLIERNQKGTQRKKLLQRAENLLRNPKILERKPPVFAGETLQGKMDLSLESYLQAKEKLQKTLKEVNKAISKDPKKESLFYWRGRVYLELGHKREAARDFQKYLKLNPQSPQEKLLRKFIEENL